jgi:hypothetical protein
MNCNPIRYPKQPPSIEPREQTTAYLIDFTGKATDRAIKRTSGGIGKKEDSQKARTNNAHVPWGVLAKCRIQP